MMSFIAICFEKMIVEAVQEAKPRFTNPDVASEANSFLRQEAQHANAHRQQSPLSSGGIRACKKPLTRSWRRTTTWPTRSPSHTDWPTSLTWRRRSRPHSGSYLTTRTSCFGLGTTVWPRCCCGTGSKRSNTAARQCHLQRCRRQATVSAAHTPGRHPAHHGGPRSDLHQRRECSRTREGPGVRPPRDVSVVACSRPTAQPREARWARPQRHTANAQKC